MSDPIPVEQGATEQTEEFVSIEEAADADLDSYLSEGEKEPEPKPAESQPEKKLEQPQPKKAEAPQTPDPAKADAPVSAEVHRKTLERLRAQELYNDRRGTEIGELRKQLRERDERLAQLTSKEAWIEDPQEAHKAQRERDKVTDNLSALDEEEQQLQAELVGKKIVANHLTPEEYDVDTAAAMLAEDGVSENFLNAFRANPLQTVYPETLVHIMKRAQLQTVLKKIIPATKKLLDDYNALKQQNVEQGTKTARQIQKNLSQPAGLNGSTATASASIEDAAATDFSDMSSAQLDEFLQSARKRER